MVLERTTTKKSGKFAYFFRILILTKDDYFPNVGSYKEAT